MQQLSCSEYGCTAVWLYGYMGVWLYGLWRYGCMEVWLYGLWMYGCMGVWVNQFLPSSWTPDGLLATSSLPLLLLLILGLSSFTGLTPHILPLLTLTLHRSPYTHCLISYISKSCIINYIQEVSEKQAPPTTTPLEPTSMSPQLSNTLQHIVGQLDILTQVGQQPRNEPHMFHIIQRYHCSLS